MSDEPRTPADVPRRGATVFAAALTGVVVGGAFAPYVLRQDLFTDDAAQHVYWAYGYRDAALFAGDRATEFFRDVAAPIGYRLAYRTLAAVGDVQVMSELAGAAAALLTCALLFLLGRRSCRAMPYTGAAVAVTLFLASRPVVTWLESAMLQRSFGPIALALGMWALMARRMAWLGAAFLVAALFYPVAIAGLGLTAILHEAWRLWRDRRLPRGWPVAAVAGVVAIGLVLFDPTPEWVGSVVTYDQARAMPIFAEGGRNAFFLDDPVQYYFGDARTARAGLGYSPATLAVAVAALIGLALIVGPRRARAEVPAAAWATLAAALALYVAAHLTLFALYLPNRHTHFALPLAWITAASALGPPAYARLFARRRPDRTRVGATAAVAFVVLAGAAVGWRSAGTLSRAAGGGQEAADKRAAMAYLRDRTPPGTLVAAHPALANQVPMLARRPVVASVEWLQGYYAGYHDWMAPRFADSVAAYYADAWATIDRLADEHGAELFLFHPSALPGGKGLPEPYAAAADGIAGEPGRRFVLADPPPDRVAFRAGDWTIVRLGDDDPAR